MGIIMDGTDTVEDVSVMTWNSGVAEIVMGALVLFLTIFQLAGGGPFDRG